MNKLFKLTSLLLVTVFMFSCNENEGIEDVDMLVANKSKAKLLTMEEIRKVGTDHNDAMVFIYNEFVSNGTTIQGNEETIEEILNSNISGFFSQLYKGGEDTEIANRYSQEETGRMFDEFESSTYRQPGAPSPLQAVINRHEGHLSQDQVLLLNDIQIALDGAMGDYQKSIEQLDLVQQSASKSLSAEDAQPILVGAEIAKASLEYWRGNLSDWQNALLAEGQGASKWFSWSEVAGADVAGGVAAAVTTAIVNAAPGAGQVAYGGAIVGGAVGASAGDVVLQIWRRIF